METRRHARIRWIDDIKIIAGLLMVLDHSLLYFEQETSWPRQSVTRAVEPLYVFAFAYLLSSKRPRSLLLNRWWQLALAAFAETLLFSTREDQLHFGILASLAIVWPFAHWFARVSNSWLVCFTLVLGTLTLFPPSFQHVTIDYDPWLVLLQVSLAIAFQRKLPRINFIVIGIWLSHIAILGILASHGVTTHANVWTILVGHPLAVLLLIATACQSSWRWPQRLRLIVTYPLTFYLGHLALLAWLAKL